MNHEITGRAWVFGDSIDTDAMYPGFAMKLPLPEAARHVFYDLRPGWTGEVRPGDIVVAGRNFGIGSSRPVAALMRHLGVAALVAEEFNSLFYRNAINNGLPALTVPGARELVREGETLANEVAGFQIRVNVIAPGTVNTPMVTANVQQFRLFRPDVKEPTAADVEEVLRNSMPMGLPWIEPEQISDAVVFLASDSARYITGTVLPVDQGTTNH